VLIKRTIEHYLIEAAQDFPVLAILGPRQSGKTTLAQAIFKDYTYVNLEDLSLRELASTDPKGFLNSYKDKIGVILDEIQHVPALFSYLQVIVDQQPKKGFYILTGSQNFVLNEKITQSLAGRVALLTLLPLSLHELESAQLIPDTIEEFVFNGCYPKIYKENISVERLYKNYVQTYVEQDVRQIKNVTDLILFKKFLSACAARTGQLLNLSSLAQDLGISHNTVNSWLSVLVSSYIIFLVQPYYKTYSKRLSKSPKLYFNDTGLACSLLGITSAEQVMHSYLRGSLIETSIMSDLLKQYYNLDKDPSLYFWRDQTGHEIDAILDTKPFPTALEIKASMTVSPDFFKGIQFWNSITKNESNLHYVIYGGNDSHPWPQGTVLSWKRSGDIIQNLIK